MKRGLSSLDRVRIPEQVYRDRQQRLRAALREAGVDAAFLYCDVSSGGDIAYLTHSTLYWSFGALLVMTEGPTVFLPGLSPRTESWFSATSVFDRIVSSTSTATAVAELCEQSGVRRLGVIEADRLPSRLAGELASGKVELVDLGPIVRRMREVPDEAADVSLGDVAEIGAAGLAAVADALSAGSTLAQARAAGEYAIRVAGAWDAVAEVQASAADGAVVRLRCQVRDGWYGAERHFGAPGVVAAWAREASRALSAALQAGATREVLLGMLEERPFPGAALIDVELESAPDIEARPALETERPLRVGEAVHLALGAWTPDGAVITRWGDVFRITAQGAERVQDSPMEAP